jgi:site-specific recombinase XerD
MTPLRQRMLDDMQVRNLASNTQASYLQQVSAFAKFFHQSPDQLGPEHIRTYQVHLTTVKRLAPSSLGIAVAALRFFYLKFRSSFTLLKIVRALELRGLQPQRVGVKLQGLHKKALYV